MREFQVHLEEECHNYLFTDIKQKTLKVGKIHIIKFVGEGVKLE